MNNDSLLQAAQHSLTMAVLVGDLCHPDRFADRRCALPLPLSR
nr:Uncharacterised protein [Raoultella sp. NCTC 9187]